MADRPPYRILTAFLVAMTAAAALLRPLADPDEGRYAEAAREMLATGDLLLPRQAGVVYPDKPAGIYWLMVPFLAVLGPGATAARLPALLAFLALLGLLAATGRRQDRPAHGACAAWIAAGCPLLAALGQLATLDMVLSFFTTAGILAGRRWLHAAHRRAAWLAGAALGAGFLVKGPVAWALPLLILTAAALAEGRGRDLRRLLSPRFLLPMLLLGLGWYAAAAFRDPELLDFWICRETLARLAGDLHGRRQPLWYVPALAIAVLLPWLAGAAWCRWRRPAGPSEPAHPDRRLHMVWALLPVLFFSLPAGKQPAYLAPAIPGFALWLAESWSRATWQRARAVLTGILVIAYAALLLLMLDPQRSRSADSLAAAVQAAGAEEWRGGQLNGWSYGFAYRLRRADLESCGPNPRAWAFAEGLGRVPVRPGKEERYACATAILASAEPAFLLVLDAGKDPRNLDLPEFMGFARSAGAAVWEWRRLGDRVLLANRPPPVAGE